MADFRGSPAQCAAELGRRIMALKVGLMAAERQNLIDGVKLAQEASSGPYSSKVLAEKGHPYSLRNPNPPQDPAIVNFQTGDFFRGWKSRVPRVQGGNIVSKIVNIDPKAQDVAQGISTGRKLSVPRPIVNHIMKQLRPIRLRRLQQAVRSALKL